MLVQGNTVNHAIPLVKCEVRLSEETVGCFSSPEGMFGWLHVCLKIKAKMSTCSTKDTSFSQSFFLLTPKCCDLLGVLMQRIQQKRKSIVA